MIIASDIVAILVSLVGLTLMSGSVFLKGNEHRILKLAEERRCKLGGHIEVVLRGSGRDRL